MKKLTMLLFLLTCAALPLHAQMSTQDTYDSESSDGTYIYTSVTLEGEISPNIDLNPVHTYTNSSTLNGVNSTLTRQGGRGQYVSVTNPQELAYTEGLNYEWDEDESVDCNYMGEFFDVSSTKYVEVAYERTIGQGTPYNCYQHTVNGAVVTTCWYPQVPWCSVATTPPDLNVPAIEI